MEIQARLAVSKEGREKRRVPWANRDPIIEIYRQEELMTRRLHVVDPSSGCKDSGDRCIWPEARRNVRFPDESFFSLPRTSRLAVSANTVVKGSVADNDKPTFRNSRFVTD